MTHSVPEVGSNANSYAIVAKLATGGMADIFLARTASVAGIERYVVLKRVLRHRANEATFVHMFLDEARLAAQLQHPNIAQVYDTGVLGDSYFFTMEYVHGENVREILMAAHERRLAMPIGAALAIGASAAAGLHHAHERRGIDGKPLGIVHRDVSPSNVMVSFEGNVKIVDFGVAKATQRRTSTQVGTVKGKISYLSPEQCRGRVIDRRSDLFSLGIVLWELLVGGRLYKQPTDYDVMSAIVHTDAPPPSSRRADVPPEVDALVGKLLARDPDERYQTGADVLEAIEHVALKIGVPLSSAALGRFVRELFGARAEPWIEMQTRDGRAEIVTVTAAPIVGDEPSSAIGIDDIDSRLALVPGIPARTPTRTPTPLMRPTGVSAAADEYPSTGSYSSVNSRPVAGTRWRSRVVQLGVAGALIAGGVAGFFAARTGPDADAVSSAASEHASPPPAVTVDAPIAAVAAPPDAVVAAPAEVAATPVAPATEAKPRDKPEVSRTKPKADASRSKATRGDAARTRAEPPPTPPPASDSAGKPKPDCDVDPMSCRR